MSLRSHSLRNALMGAACAAILAGCPTGSDVTDPTPETDGGVGEGGTLPDGAVPVACGRLTNLCGDGAKCAGSADCTSQLCTGGACAAVAPADGVKNGDETDVDCGGTKSPACVDTKGCALASDCKSGVCTNKICQAPTSTDGVQNGNETGVDCGGTSTGAPKCPTGTGCLVDGDCANVKCDTVQKKCASASHSDGLKNDGETGVDCGGPSPTKCATGEGCASNADCNAVACDAAGTKLCLAATHSDGITNLGETGVDCGGAAPTKCATGQGCLATTDCNKVLCDVAVTKLCLAASHTDGILNLGETGIDCGGAALPLTCGVGVGCAVTADCTKAKCNAGTLVCDPPTKTDLIQNGTETDVDCGGGAPTNAGACALGLSCLVASDCASTTCNYAKKCVESPSCTPHFGGDTCGKGEVGQVGAAHESCCARLPLPANASVAIGKYEITSGRVREFIKQTGGNVRGWVDANRAKTTQISDGVLAFLPQADKLPIRTYPSCQRNNLNQWVCAPVTRDFGVYTHLGSTTIFPDRPCRNCGQGCWFNTGAGQNGHTTYWFDAATQSTEWGAGAKVATQAELDVKSQNCVTQVLLAAFCAWDGGRLPTQAELGGVNGAWGPGGMPWGGSSTSFRDTVAGNEAGRIVYPFNQDGTCPGNSCFLVPMLTAAGGYNAAAATVNTTNFNPFPSSPGVFNARYVYPVPADTATNDQAYAVAAPGRMRNDFRSVGPGATDGFYDVAANLIEMTGTVTSSDTGNAGDPNDPAGFHLDSNGNPLPGVSWVGGSFEGHTPNNRGGYDLDVLTKYGKAGGRCAYDLP